MPETIPSLPTQTKAALQDIKLSHSVFAMPFALLGAGLVCAERQAWPTWLEISLVIGCMVSARTWAMLLNRWFDASIDANNPRTAGRAIPSGRANAQLILLLAIACGVIFIACCAGFMFTPYKTYLPISLALPTLALIGGYPLVKRFSWLCHAVLGLSLGISPLCASAALHESYPLTHSEPWLLMGMVSCWVTGFDILYALQDMESDKANGVYAVPACLGQRNALLMSYLLHVAAIVFLLVLCLSPNSALGHPIFWIATTVGILLLCLEHIMVARHPQKWLHHAFFTVNGFFSLFLGIMGLWTLFIS